MLQMWHKFNASFIEWASPLNLKLKWALIGGNTSVFYIYSVSYGVMLINLSFLHVFSVKYWYLVIHWPPSHLFRQTFSPRVFKKYSLFEFSSSYPPILKIRTMFAVFFFVNENQVIFCGVFIGGSRIISINCFQGKSTVPQKWILQ